MSGKTASVWGYPYEPGCYVDGHHGQYAADQLADFIETEFGYFDSNHDWSDDPRVIREIEGYLDRLGALSRGIIAAFGMLTDEFADAAIEWLNDGTDYGYHWTWHEGGVYLFQDDNPEEGP